MNRKSVFYISLLIWATLVSLLNISFAQRDADHSMFDPLVDVCELVRKYYVVETDEDDLAAGAINGMLHELDPYSEFIPADEIDEFHKQASGSYEGIGIGIDVKDGYLIVISPFEDSPAYKAGVLPGDRIIEVNNLPSKGWSATRAIKELTGPAGTEVVIKVLHRDGSEEVIPIRREQIHVPSIRGSRRAEPQQKDKTDADADDEKSEKGVNEKDVSEKDAGEKEADESVDEESSVKVQSNGWDYFIDEELLIGYLRISNFTADTANELDRAVEQLMGRNMSALIIDLRSNPGGLMTSAVEVVDRFIDEGVIVSTRGAHTSEQAQKATTGSTYPRFPLVVLIDQGSASASEIVAGALQDHSRAVIVGKRSWGKGSVQRLIHLSDSGAALKLTTDYYYLPKGRCVHRIPGEKDWGVSPDIEEDLDLEKLPELRRLMAELTRVPLPDEKVRPKKELIAELLDLDPQLNQAVKQCKGLLRAQPKLEGLAHLQNDMESQSESPVRNQ
ncbi:MAG: S41 family peptidase [Sedimentisphaerales bacterium]|nr:S41 family peptidase [Sedimentisphaerales bacterium]